jgi:riboflavin kinase/FMN adenylyltransferase
MSLPQQIDGLENVASGTRPLHLAIGIFDGVHLGHRAVIEAAVQSAHRSGGESAVLTFDPHPSVLLRPEQPTRLIMGREAKARVLGSLGVGAVITQAFTRELAQIEPEQFLPWLRQRLPHLAAVYVGQNWRFGRQRRGDIALLVAEGRKHGVSVFSAPPVSLDGETISSSRIRVLLAEGNIAAANAMLGYAYFAQGVVRPGKRVGRMLGFPTLNLAWSPGLQPRFGVYVVRVEGGKSTEPLNGVANYGLRPTIEKTPEPRLEVHVLGECPYDAGDELTVEWLDFLRPEKKFEGVGELRVQITADRETARAFFAR